MADMKVVHIVEALLRNSGVGVFVAELASAQTRALHRAAILCRWYPECEADERVDYRTDPHLREFRGLCDGDAIVHVHAIWAWYTLRALLCCWRQRVAYVVSPHGGLMPRVFQHGRLKKWIFWHFFLKSLVRRAVAIHCTGETEAAAVRRLLGERCPMIVIAPLGVHLPELREKPKKEVKTVLFLGRLGEEKGLVQLLDAWNQVRIEGWRLVIAGPDWEGHQQVLFSHCRSLHIPYTTSPSFEPQTSRLSNLQAFLPVCFPGPADPVQKDVLYRSADIFVLPSPMENFSHVVVEALSYGIPVIATKGTPWRELESEHCGCWIDQGVGPLVTALSRLMAMGYEVRAAMGMRGRKLTEGKYRWDAVSEVLDVAYQYCVKSK